MNVLHVVSWVDACGAAAGVFMDPLRASAADLGRIPIVLAAGSNWRVIRRDAMHSVLELFRTTEAAIHAVRAEVPGMRMSADATAEPRPTLPTSRPPSRQRANSAACSLQSIPSPSTRSWIFSAVWAQSFKTDFYCAI